MAECEEHLYELKQRQGGSGSGCGPNGERGSWTYWIEHLVATPEGPRPDPAFGSGGSRTVSAPRESPRRRALKAALLDACREAGYEAKDTESLPLERPANAMPDVIAAILCPDRSAAFEVQLRSNPKEAVRRNKRLDAHGIRTAWLYPIRLSTQASSRLTQGGVDAFRVEEPDFDVLVEAARLPLGEFVRRWLDSPVQIPHVS